MPTSFNLVAELCRGQVSEINTGKKNDKNGYEDKNVNIFNITSGFKSPC